MTRVLVFLGALAAGLGLLVHLSGGLEGPRVEQNEPVVERVTAPTARDAAAGAGAGVRGPAGIDVRDVDGPRYALPEARVVRDPRSGESVDVPHFVPWTFQASAGRPSAGEGGAQGSVVFEDVVVRLFRAPATLDEARRLRSDPRATDAFLRLEMYARTARADGIARYLQGSAAPAGPRSDTTIRLDGDVVVHDVEHDIWVRGTRLTFDPDAGRAVGEGRFLVEHAAWTIDGDGLVLEKDARLPDLYRIAVERGVLLTLRDALLDPSGRPLLALDPEGFRPARVLARRAVVLSDEAGGRRLHVALEGDVRALQEGGRRMAADRLRLTVEQPQPAAPPSASPGQPARFVLADLVAEGRPLVIDVPDLATDSGGRSEARVTARRLRREAVPLGEPDLVLEGEPVLVLAGDVPLPGLAGEGAYVRASARDRAVLSSLDDVGRDAAGLPVPGRRLVLSGDARLMRRGPGSEPYEDVLEGERITLHLRPVAREPGAAPRETPVSFAAEGHVRLSGTRVAGEAERIQVERLDTLEPLLRVEGPGTRFELRGLARGQRLLGRDPASDAETAPASGAGGAAPPEDEWVLERVEASGRLAASTVLGGPSVGVPARVEGARATYERVDGLARLHGAPGQPAFVQMEAQAERAHRLRAATLTLDVARARVRAEGGADAEVWLGAEGADGLPAGMAPSERMPAPLGALALATDDPIEVRFRLAQPGGEPALDQPQALRVLGPFTAEMRAASPGPVDRVRADRLDALFARRVREAAPVRSAPLARSASRPAAPSERPAPRAGAPGAATALTRWTLAARDLAVALEDGRVSTFEAEGGVTIDGQSLACEGERLRFERAVGALLLDGGARGAAARFGAANAESRVRARALRVLLAEDGPRWVLATGPTQALLVQRAPDGGSEQFEVDSRGDVRITANELSAPTPTWVRRRERARDTAPWGAPAEIWADRVSVTGRNLLEGAGAGAGERVVERIVAEGPSTTVQAGEGAERIQMWCERVLVDAATGVATLRGRPGVDVRVRRGTSLDLELLSASFNLRTRQLSDLEAGSAVLRRGDR